MCNYVMYLCYDVMPASFASFGRDMLVGGTAAVVAKTTVAPIERVKLLLQLQDTSTQIRPENHYKGIIDCIRRIPQEQGFASFWRGNLTNVYRYFCTQALNFAFKDAYREHWTPKYSPNKNLFWRTFAGNLASGGAAGVTTMCLTYPLDFARTRLSTDVGSGSSRQFRGLWHCIHHTVTTDGIRSLYRGLPISIPNVLIYRSVYFGSFDTAKSYLSGSLRSPIILTWLLAQSCTTVAGLIGYPMDTVRRRMVMQSGRQAKDVHYKSAVDCCKKMYKHEGGFRAFYKGALTNVFRSMGSALILVFYDEVKRFV